MRLTDVNVLLFAHREESERHDVYRDWWNALVNGTEVFGVSELVLSSFLRIITNPRIFKTPTPTERAFDIADGIRSRPNCVLVTPSERHWGIFENLCRLSGARGNLVPDAYLAALAIDSGSEWITTDRDFSRFPGLRWRHPLQ